MATQVNMGNVSEQFLPFQRQRDAALGDSDFCSAISIHFLPLSDTVVTVLAPLVLWASILQSVVQTQQSEDLPLP